MKTFFKFCLVGAVGFGVDFTVFSIIGSILGFFFGKVIGFVTAVQCTFFLNKYLTFQKQSASYVMYILGQFKGFLINFFSFSTIYFLLQPSVAAEKTSFVIASAITLFFNFFYAKHLVFRSLSAPKEYT